MAKIVDPDDLTRNVEITFDTSLKTIQLSAGGSSNIIAYDGVTLQCVYSKCKELWKSESDLIRLPFPFVSITEESFELINGWDWKDTNTRNYVRDGGWALKDASGVSQEEYMNVTSLGSFDNSGIDNAYYLQASGGTPTDMVYTGEVNQAVKIYGDATHGNFNYRDYFKIFLREEQKLYDSYDLMVEQNLSVLTYKKYAMPLSNGIDLKVTHTDTVIATGADYTNIDITYYSTSQGRLIGSTTYYFHVIIEGDDKPAETIYEKIQYLLRQTGDIDEGAGIVRGDIADELLQFIGDTLRTLYVPNYGGVFIDNFQATDTNRLEFTDDTQTIRTYPYVAAGNLLFNDNLQNDSSAYYWMFFTSVPSGSYGTVDAIIVQDNSSDPISGAVSGASSISFDFDYDGNTQGGRTAGTDAPVTVVAIGLNTAQYVKTTSTIARSTANNISLVSSLERNYSNPA
jgi:hypothetical protein